MTGVMYKVRSCDTMRPATTAMPNGRRASAPAPIPSAMGSVPMIAAMVVIMIGRKRTRHASKIASAGVRFALRCASSAKSIIMMAFFFTIPISIKMPTKP